MNDNVMHKVHEEQERLARKFEDAADEAQDMLRHGVRDASRYVRHNAWQAVAVAAGIGLLVGWLAGRK
jgi:ElaB/YqjD/DUF883 family membrane-anchored ribosome-binding protein